MKIRIMNIVKVEAKVISAIIIAVLTVFIVGIVSVSATSIIVDSGSIKQLIYEGNMYESNTLNTDGNTCSFYSMPTYGAVDQEGPYSLDVDKEGLLWSTQVIGRNLNIYKRMANTADSVYLGKTSGEKLYFSVCSRDGSDGAKFYLTKFHGEARH